MIWHVFKYQGVSSTRGSHIQSWPWLTSCSHSAHSAGGVCLDLLKEILEKGRYRDCSMNEQVCKVTSQHTGVDRSSSLQRTHKLPTPAITKLLLIPAISRSAGIINSTWTAFASSPCAAARCIFKGEIIFFDFCSLASICPRREVVLKL